MNLNLLVNDLGIRWLWSWYTMIIENYFKIIPQILEEDSITKELDLLY